MWRLVQGTSYEVSWAILIEESFYKIYVIQLFSLVPSFFLSIPVLTCLWNAQQDNDASGDYSCV